MPYKDRSEYIAYQKAYRASHRDENRVYQKAYYADWVRLPRSVVVYRWFEPDTGVTLYVGRGTSRRPHWHRSRSLWATSTMVLKMQIARNEWHAMALEGRWGERYQPIHNKDGYRR